jgi:hypothetical protein
MSDVIAELQARDEFKDAIESGLYGLDCLQCAASMLLKPCPLMLLYSALALTQPRIHLLDGPPLEPCAPATPPPLPASGILERPQAGQPLIDDVVSVGWLTGMGELWVIALTESGEAITGRWSPIILETPPDVETKFRNVLRLLYTLRDRLGISPMIN